MKKIITMLVFSVIVTMPTVAYGIWETSSVNTGATGLPGATITSIVTNVMLWILGLVGLFGIIGFAVAGIFYLTAAGNDDQMEKGKNGMMWSIIGVVVALMGYVIIQAVDAMLNAGSAY